MVCPRNISVDTLHTGDTEDDEDGDDDDNNNNHYYNTHIIIIIIIFFVHSSFSSQRSKGFTDKALLIHCPSKRLSNCMAYINYY
jgi:hypothetical protein